MRRLFREVSDTWNYRKNPPPTRSLLNMRIRRDKEKWLRVLRTHGYYRATVSWQIEGGDARPRVRIEVDLNNPFTFAPVRIEVKESANDRLPPAPVGEELGIRPGTQARHESILAAEKKLVAYYRSWNYPFARVSLREVRADHATGLMEVYFLMDTGPRARFGPLTTEGLEHVKGELVTNMIPWRPRGGFRPDQVDEFRDRLNRDGLFSIVRLSHASELDEEGLLHMHLEVTEGKPKTVGVGLGYNTAWGVGMILSRENRNVRGGGERFNVEVHVAEKLKQGEASYEIPSLFTPDLRAQLRTRLGHDRPPAYDSLFWRHMGGALWRISRQASAGLAVAAKTSQIKQFNETTDYLVMSLPAHLTFDYRNDPAEPTYGGMLHLEVEPIANLTDESMFVKERLRFLQLLRVWRKPQIMLAGRLGLGSMQGSGIGQVPPDERFYAGGSESVRGYAYQKVGPLREGTPTGGRSLLTLSGELAVTLFEPVALVGFVDGGHVFEEAVPASFGDLQWGVGTGLRVSTAVGAIGLEIGFPVNRRPEDDAYQFYISVGYQF